MSELVDADSAADWYESTPQVPAAVDWLSEYWSAVIPDDNDAATDTIGSSIVCWCCCCGGGGSWDDRSRDGNA
jgi:hypothetical protein